MNIVDMPNVTWVCGICACETTRCYCLVGPSPMKIDTDKWNDLTSRFSLEELKQKTRQALSSLILKRSVQREVAKLRQVDADFRAGLAN